MAGQIAIFEGYGHMPKRRKKRRRSFGSMAAHSRFAKIARKCSRIAKRKGGGSYMSCMARLLKKGGRKRKKK